MLKDEFKKLFTTMDYVNIKFFDIPSWTKLQVLYATDDSIVLILADSLLMEKSKVQLRFEESKYEYYACGEIQNVNPSNIVVKIFDVMRYENQRLHSRIDVLIDCMVTKDGVTTQSKIFNISKSGMLISNMGNYNIDDILNIKFNYMELKFELSGEVVRIEKVHDEIHFGILFEDAWQKRQLNTLIKKTKEVYEANITRKPFKNIMVLTDSVQGEKEYFNIMNNIGFEIYKTNTLDTYLLHKIDNLFRDPLLIDLNDYKQTIESLKTIGNYIRNANKSIIVMLPQEYFEEWINEANFSDVDAVFKPIVELEFHMALFKHL